jgi:hypothetical protein
MSKHCDGIVAIECCVRRATTPQTVLVCLFVLFSLALPLQSAAQDGSRAGPYYIVANTRPPDAFFALRTDPSISVGRCIMEMPNGTILRVLRRNQDGWWYVRVVEAGREGWALSRGDGAYWIVADNAPYQDPQYEDDVICRGVLTVNRTEQSSDNTSDDGTRLIRADHISNSCLFYQYSDVGKQILAACRMGYWCEVRATVNSVESDVSNIVSVHPIPPNVPPNYPGTNPPPYLKPGEPYWPKTPGDVANPGNLPPGGLPRN